MVFEDLKIVITIVLVFILYKLGREIMVICDGSLIGFGGVLF